MLGSPIEVFLDIERQTGPAILTGKEKFVNDAKLNTYALRRFMAGKTMSDMLQGGETIRDDIYLAEDSTAVNYNPNATIDYRIKDVLQQWRVNWRFSLDYYMWTEQHVGLNHGQLNATARHHQYKRLLYSQRMNLQTSLNNFYERQFWAARSQTTMESTAGDTPYTLLAFAHEDFLTSAIAGDGLSFQRCGRISATYDSSPTPTAWTTIMNIDPNTSNNWSNYFTGYGAFGNIRQVGSVIAGQDHLYVSLSRMHHLMNYEQLPAGAEYSGENLGTDPKGMDNPRFIATSLAGVTNYEVSLLSGQDALVISGRQDADVPHPQFKGAPVMRFSPLETVLAYADVQATPTAMVTEANAGRGGPRYYVTNGLAIKKVWHTDRFFYMIPSFRLPHQPLNFVSICDSWHNNVAKSRQQGIGLVSPAGLRGVLAGADVIAV